MLIHVQYSAQLHIQEKQQEFLFLPLSLLVLHPSGQNAMFYLVALCEPRVSAF